MIVDKFTDAAPCFLVLECGARTMTQRHLPACESEPDYKSLFEAAPGPYLVLWPDLRIAAVNEAYLAATLTRREEMLGRGLFEVFPDNPDDPAADGVRNLSASLERVLRYRRVDAMAVQKYDIPRPASAGGGFEVRYWSPVNTPVLDEAGEVAWIIHRVEDVTALIARDRLEEEKDRLAIEQQAVIERLRRANVELAGSESALKASEARFRAAIEAVSDILWTNTPDGRMAGEQPGWCGFTGQSRAACQGYGWAQAVHPDEAKPTIDAWDQAVAERRPFVFEHRVRRHDGVWRLFAIRAVPVLDDHGAVTEWVGVHTDITEAREADNRRRLLLDELNHRVKNSLATVQSIAMQTLWSSDTPETFNKSFNERLLALSHNHDLLTRSHWVGANLKDVIAQELEPYQTPDGRRVDLRGRDVHLGPKAALALGMAVHELATNAAKYGALSADEGMVEVIWRIEVDANVARLNLVWTEHGGPEVKPPGRSGFGRRLIERGLTHELGGAADLAFEPAGLRCVIDFPLSDAPQ